MVKIFEMVNIKNHFPKFFFNLILISTFFTSVFYLIIGFPSLLGRHRYLNTVFEWMKLYDDYNEQYSEIFQYILLISFTLSMISLLSWIIYESRKSTLKVIIKNITISIFIPLFWFSTFYLIFYKGYSNGFSSIDIDNMLFYPLVFLIYFFLISFCLIQLFCLRYLNPRFVNLVNYPWRRLILSTLLVVTILTMVDFGSNHDYFSSVSDQGQAIRLLTIFIFIYSIHDVIKFFNLNYNNINNTPDEKKRKYNILNSVLNTKRIFMINIIVNSIFLMPSLFVFQLYFLRLIGFRSFITKPFTIDDGLRIFIIPIVIWIILQIIFYISFYKEIKKLDINIEYREIMIKNHYNKKYLFLSIIFLIPIVIFIFAIEFLVSDVYVKQLFPAFFLILFNIGLTFLGIWHRNILFKVIKNIFKRKNNEYKRKIEFWLYNFNQWINTELNKSVLGDDQIHIWVTRGYVLLFCSIALWGIGPSLDLSSIIYHFWGEMHNKIGLFSSIIISLIFLFPLITSNYILFLKPRSFKTKNLIIVVLLNIFLLLVLLTDIGTFSIKSYYLGEYDFLINTKKIWIIFFVISFSSFFSIDMNLNTMKKMIVFYLLIGIVIFIVLLLWNHSLVQVVNSDNRSFLTDYYPFSIVLLPIILGLIYSFTLKTENKEKKNYMAKKSLKNRFSYLKKVLNKPITTGLLPIGIIILLIPISYVNNQLDAWHSYEIHSELPTNDIDYQMVIDILQSDLGEFLTASHESFYHPSYIDLKTINSMESFVKNMENTREWGNYWLNYKITMRRNVDLNIEYYQYSPTDHMYRYSNENIMGLSSNISDENQKVFPLPTNSYYYQWKNGTIYNTFEESINLPIINSSITEERYNVDMIYIEMNYGEQTGPLAGYGGYSVQSICLKDNHIIFVGYQRNNWIS